MDARTRISLLIATVAIATTAVAGVAGPASATETSAAERAVIETAEPTTSDTAAPTADAGPSIGSYAICAYEYGSRCVTWVTTNSTCYNIVNITTDKRKHLACTIFKTEGLVTVWP